VVSALAAVVACMLEAGWQFNVVVLLVCECLWLVQVQGSAAWALLVCGASWVRGSHVAPLALLSVLAAGNACS